MLTLPVLTDDPGLIDAADWLRRGLLLVGLVVAATAAHDLLTGLPRVVGIRLRVALIVLGSLYVCLATWDELGEPVTPLLALGAAYQGLALVVVRLSARHDRPPGDAERRLRGAS